MNDEFYNTAQISGNAESMTIYYYFLTHQTTLRRVFTVCLAFNKGETIFWQEFELPQTVSSPIFADNETASEKPRTELWGRFSQMFVPSTFFFFRCYKILNIVVLSQVARIAANLCPMAGDGLLAISRKVAIHRPTLGQRLIASGDWRMANGRPVMGQWLATVWPLAKGT